MNPQWRDLKAELVSKLGYNGAAKVLRFTAHSHRLLGAEGAPEHLDFAARQLELEGARERMVIEASAELVR
ncbi:MAG: hypothetical protein L6Q71_12100 [Planctomycetes bacterium]|nr:hypothetical protein [Planctomycetota bacterium]